MILPALTEAISPYWRPIKYSLFPPLGLATLAGYFSYDDEIEIQDEHVEKITTNDYPDLVVIQVYITSAYRAYELADWYRARGSYVILGGLHVTSLPDEAQQHADTIFLGPGEDTLPLFLNDFRHGNPKLRYQSTVRSLHNLPPIRRDLIKKHLYLVPNSLVLSRGCPHSCDFCYKEAFFKGGKSFYTRKPDDAIREIETLKGKHLFFLDDHLFADRKFAMSLFDNMIGMNRVWQAAGTIKTILDKKLITKAAKSGLKSLFVGFETLNLRNLTIYNKKHNLNSDYQRAVKTLRDLGVMINASFVYGMDYDDEDVFDRTVDWAVENGIETSTFHILTPYPGTVLHNKLLKENRIHTSNWNLYDTRNAVFHPKNMSVKELETGYWRSYKKFYNWQSIFKSVSVKSSLLEKLRHLGYTAGWKKFEFLWHHLIKVKRINQALPVLEKFLMGFESKHTEYEFTKLLNCD